MDDLKKQLADMETKRVEILKKMEELEAPIVRKDIEDLRTELMGLIRTCIEPKSTQSGGLVLTDVSVHGTEPWKEGRILEPETKPSRPEKVAVRKWSEFPA